MKRRTFIRNATQLGALTCLAPADIFAPGRNHNENWEIKQFKDDGLAHFSYAIVAGQKITLVDPGRDPEQYYVFAKEKKATITGIIETHPHADFVSSHLEIRQTTGATIYTSSLINPSYEFTAFDDGAQLSLSKNIVLRSIATPGHAPDAISAILQADGKDIAVFSGDSLLIGDVGRPDLREYSGDVQAKRLQLAAAMYHTLWNKFDPLSDDIVLYPAHGAGSLCGKNMRDAASSTIGYEKKQNYAFQKMTEKEFVSTVLAELPLIPDYFPYDVALNVKGAPQLKKSIQQIPLFDKNHVSDVADLVIDGRADDLFKQSHIHNAINIPDATKFETWLGTIIRPDQPFYLVAENKDKLNALIYKSSKIGYETKIKGAFVYDALDGEKMETISPSSIPGSEDRYTIIDVRTAKEAGARKFFTSAVNIPVNELGKRIKEIPGNKPIVVHCASGYRSAIAGSILKKYFPDTEILDTGKEILNYPGIKKTN